MASNIAKKAAKMAAFPNTKVKTRFLILSDTHNAAPQLADGEDPFRYPLPRVDVLLHAGDLTGAGQKGQHEGQIAWISAAPAELKIVIPGNHDVTLHESYYREHGTLHCPIQYTEQDLKDIKELYTGSQAQSSGVVFMEEGIRTFTLRNGARFTVYASAWQPEFFNWAFGYPRGQDRFNADANPEHPVPDYGTKYGVDIMLTHGPPYGILDTTYKDEAVGCEHLRRAVGRCRPLLHAFGHIHEAWGAIQMKWNHSLPGSGQEQDIPVDQQRLMEQRGVYVDATHMERGEETLFVNASIMDLQYNPVQGPWIVDLELES